MPIHAFLNPYDFMKARISRLKMGEEFQILELRLSRELKMNPEVMH